MGLTRETQGTFLPASPRSKVTDKIYVVLTCRLQDYSKRAKNFNEKKDQLQRLRQKAQARNPDEFAFGMMSDKSKSQGRHGGREQSRAMSVQAVRRLKKQDEAYTRVMEDRARRKMQKEEKVAPWQGKKVVFVDTPEEQAQTALAGNC